MVDSNMGSLHNKLGSTDFIEMNVRADYNPITKRAYMKSLGSTTTSIVLIISFMTVKMIITHEF